LNDYITFEKKYKMSNTLFNYMNIENHNSFNGLSPWELNAWYMVYSDREDIEKLKKIIEAVKLLPTHEQYIFKQLKQNVKWD